MAMNTVLINTTGGFYKIYMKKILLLLVCCLELYGCKIPYKMPIGLPTPNNLFNHAPDGPPDFQYGWENGCKSAAGPLESYFYGDAGTLAFEKNFEYADSHPDYEVGWQMGWWYCLRLAERQNGFNGGKSQGLW